MELSGDVDGTVFSERKEVMEPGREGNSVAQVLSPKEKRSVFPS